MRVLVVLVFLIACSSKKPSPESPKPSSGSMLDCGMVADHVATTVMADKPRPGATFATIKELVSTRCQADAWNDDTKQCLQTIATIQEGRACASKMTDEQRKAIHASALALRKDANPPAEADDHSSDWVRHVVEEPGTKTR